MSHQDECSSDDSDDYCPALPPHLLKSKEEKIIGPTLPPGMSEAKLSELAEEYKSSSSEDDETYGPVPGKKESHEEAMFLQRRAQLIKQGVQEKQKPSREAWMTELPEEKSKLAIFGMNARTFSSKPPAEKGDTSAWTETPSEREMKKLKGPEKAVEKNEPLDTKDEEIAKYVDEYNSKKRPLSLVEMHQSKKKKDEVPKERRPFNREEDLKVNKFDEAQREVILKKARQLDDRFSRGSQRFL